AEDRIPAPWPVSHGSEWMGRPSASPTPGLPARGPNACYDAGESHPHNARTRHVTTPASESIQILGAREHNLKNVSLELPRGRLRVITGVAGAGKPSRACDTIYAEAQRRYVESVSSYARQFLDRLPRPDVDAIHGLSPAVAIQPASPARS